MLRVTMCMCSCLLASSNICSYLIYSTTSSCLIVKFACMLRLVSFWIGLSPCVDKEAVEGLVPSPSLALYAYELTRLSLEEYSIEFCPLALRNRTCLDAWLCRSKPSPCYDAVENCECPVFMESESVFN